MNIFESIAERRIEDARKAGFFDDLAMKGKPIPDLDRERPPGWWAARVARRERSIDRARELDIEVTQAVAALWRLQTETEVRDTVQALNARIDDYNAVTTWEPYEPLSPERLVARWRRHRG